MQVHRDRINLVGMIKRRRQTDVQKRGAMLTCLYFVKPCHQIWNDGYFSFNFGHKKPTCCIHLIPNADQPRGKIEGGEKKEDSAFSLWREQQEGAPVHHLSFFVLLFCLLAYCNPFFFILFFLFFSSNQKKLRQAASQEETDSQSQREGGFPSTRLVYRTFYCTITLDTHLSSKVWKRNRYSKEKREKRPRNVAD